MKLKKLTEDDILQLRIKDMKIFLKNINSIYCLKNKKEYLKRINILWKYVHFPWRKDQKKIIKFFLKKHHEYKLFVIQGVFGSGKTSMLMGILINTILSKIEHAKEMFFISFNICIRNELRRKIRDIGFNKHIKVRTFDSLIYEICKNYEYPHLSLPNFDGKRRFVYEVCKDIKNNKRTLIPLSIDPKILFIDETQDLEQATILIFDVFFRNTKIIFAGDIFQSIQKEPRESLLWYLLNVEDPKIHKSYFYETPRVPKNILTTIKKTLTTHYPEFKNEISKWKSSNPINSEIIWKQFFSYSDIMSQIDDFCTQNSSKNTMLLTFSSAITVRGSLGDVARFRRFLNPNYELNYDHKKLDTEKLFLSTANSSKGLERDNILVVLTFPLENAFINFSDDLVVNLLTVALTRCKKKLIVYVPAYIDKFSRVLNLYEDCPKPTKKRIREGKILSEFKFGDFMDMEHSVTELLKQSIISYDTRIIIKENIKLYDSDRVFDDNINIKPLFLPTEEERALIGIIIENLITSKWLNKWPKIVDYKVLKNHPLYSHCYKKISKLAKNYSYFISKNSFNNYMAHFKGILYYSQFHIALYNKVFIRITQNFSEKIAHYWKTLSPIVHKFKPKNGKIEIQNNMRMPWLTGISDVQITTEINDKKEINIWELKASTEFNWQDDALSQVFLYALMSGKPWSRLTLLNPFRNQKSLYYFNSKKIMKLRKLVINDIITWNANCYLAKNYNAYNKNVFKIDNKIFVHFNIKKNKITQFSIIKMLSPTKMMVKHDIYFKISDNYYDDKALNSQIKLQKESEHYSENAKGILDDILKKFSNYEIWIINRKIKFEVKNCYYVKELLSKSDMDIENELEYQKNPDLKYCLNFKDSVVQNISYLCYLSQKYKFI